MQNFNAGYYIKENDYKSFIPEPINREFNITNMRIVVLLEKASKLLGELNAYSRNLPNIERFLYMLAMEEATISSKIEGTHTTINEVASPEESVAPEKRDDRIEVLNYLHALDQCYGRIKGKKGLIIKKLLKNNECIEIEKLPICTRLIKEAHSILLNNARGKNKCPGEIRRTQNWIGGSMPSTASFVPPVPNEVSRLMGDLESFWNNDYLNIPTLIKIAISHYQFETIHPFLDGNGRIGRLLIILQLINSNTLEFPTLYLSRYFEKDRRLYYDTLSSVRERNDIEKWIQYFLEGICDTSLVTIDKLKKIDELTNECEVKIRTLGGRVENAHNLLEIIYAKPYITINDIKEILDVAYQTANELVKSFIDLNILTQLNNDKRYRQFVFKRYLNIFE